MIEITKGRGNLSATIYVPYDCKNNCKFCTSKKEYKNVNEAKVIEAIDKIKQLDIKEIVITGGEPMSNMMFLRYVTKILGEGRDIYINTNFIDNQNTDNFIDFVNKTDCIKGINISRHRPVYHSDVTITNNILEDYHINRITKPVRINIVLENEMKSNITFQRYIERWKDYNVHLNFRANYNNITKDTLYSFQDKNLEILNADSDEFLGVSKCNVCQTLHFQFNGLKYSYHKGLPLTSIFDKENSALEINDIIVFPDGTISYDWDRKVEFIDEMLSKFGYKQPIKKQNNVVLNELIISEPSKDSCGSFRYQNRSCGYREIKYNSCGGVIKNGC